MTAAFAARIKPATAKFVLVAFADAAHDEDGLCWPSLAAIEAKTGLDRKTVQTAMIFLLKLGALQETEERRGRTHQVKVYRVPDKIPDSETSPKTEHFRNSEEEAQSSDKEARFSREEAQKRATEPREPKGTQLTQTPPAWIPLDAWQGWLEVRTKMRAPNTERALALAVAELLKLKADGFQPGAVLEQSTARGWRGLFPIKTNGNGHHPGNGADPPKRICVFCRGIILPGAFTMTDSGPMHDPCKEKRDARPDRPAAP